MCASSLAENSRQGKQKSPEVRAPLSRLGARRESPYAPFDNLPLHGLAKRITSRAAPMPTRKGPTPMTFV